MRVEKEVRDYLRACDILLARLRTGKPLTADEVRLIQEYNARIQSLLGVREGGYQHGKGSKDLVSAD